MNYIIRKSRLVDMNSVEDAHKRSILEICSRDYNSDQIEKFCAVKYSSDIWNNSLANDFHVVVEVSGKIEGMCHAKMREDGDGEIAGLYFSKKILGKGIGREVVEMAFNYLNNFKPKKIVLTGTVTARPFYEKMGFSMVEEFNINIRGAELTCFRMEKVL